MNRRLVFELATAQFIGRREDALCLGRLQTRYLTGLLSAKKRTFLARDHSRGLSPAGTFDAVLILR